MRLQSQVIITGDYTQTIADLRQLAKEGEQFVVILREGGFLVEDVKLAIEKAYLASQEKTIIILAADHYSDIVQNRLLKVIEEPPPNKEFVLLFPAKAMLLPTIHSRLPVLVLEAKESALDLDLNLSSLDIRSVYDFVQHHSRVRAPEARKMVEQILSRALFSQQYNLDEKSLQLAHDAVKVLDRGSPPAFVLTALLLKLLARKKR